MTDEDLDRLEQLARAATPGPWYTVELPWRARGCGTYVVAGNPDPHVGRPVLDSIEIDEWPAEYEAPDYSQSDADLEFAAAARSAVPALIAQLREARRRCEGLAERVAAQSELLTRPAAGTPAAPAAPAPPAPGG